MTGHSGQLAGTNAVAGFETHRSLEVRAVGMGRCSTTIVVVVEVVVVVVVVQE